MRLTTAAGLLIGKNRESGRRVYFVPNPDDPHLLMLGASGCGKTALLELLVRQHIRLRHGLCLLDVEGELYDRILTYCAKGANMAERVVLIDPHEEKYRFGLNYYDMPDSSPDRVASLFVEAIYKVFGQDQRDTKVLMERWIQNAVSVLIRHPRGPYTPAELHQLFVNQEWRRAFLAQVPENRAQTTEWEYLESLSQRDQNFQLLAPIVRAIKFCADERMEEIVGQPSSVRWREAMDEGKIVLVNLRAGGQVSSGLSRMLGVMIFHQIVEAALERPEGSRPFYTYIDEFAELVTDDFKRSFKRLRKRGVYFHIATQELEDLKLTPEDLGLLTSVLMSASTKMVFGLGYEDEARMMAKQMFGPHLTGKIVKWQGPPITNAIPYVHDEEIEVVTSFGGESQMFPGFLPGGQVPTPATGSSSGEAFSRTTQQRTTYEYEQRETPPQYYPMEEEERLRAADIMRQGRGELFMKWLPNVAPIPVATVIPGTKGIYPRAGKELWVSPERKRSFVDEVYQRMRLKEPVEVRRIIAERRELAAPAIELTPVTDEDIAKAKGLPARE